MEMKFNKIRMKMTVEEYESTDFYEMTDKLLVDAIKALGEIHNLSREYEIELVDETGNVIDTKEIKASISPETFVYAHPNVWKDPYTEGYKMSYK